MKINKKNIIKYIDACDDFLLYKDNIVKQMVDLPSGCYFKLPSANTDWCNDIFKIILHLCYKYPYTFFVVSNDGDLAGCLYIYINPNQF